jgi:hypothetical protein
MVSQLVKKVLKLCRFRSFRDGKAVMVHMFQQWLREFPVEGIHCLVCGMHAAVHGDYLMASTILSRTYDKSVAFE